MSVYAIIGGKVFSWINIFVVVMNMVPVFKTDFSNLLLTMTIVTISETDTLLMTFMLYTITNISIIWFCKATAWAQTFKGYWLKSNDFIINNPALNENGFSCPWFQLAYKVSGTTHIHHCLYPGTHSYSWVNY